MSANGKADLQISSINGGLVPARDIRLIQYFLLYTGWKMSGEWVYLQAFLARLLLRWLLFFLHFQSHYSLHFLIPNNH